MTFHIFMRTLRQALCQRHSVYTISTTWRFLHGKRLDAVIQASPNTRQIATTSKATSTAERRPLEGKLAIVTGASRGNEDGKYV